MFILDFFSHFLLLLKIYAFRQRIYMQKIYGFIVIRVIILNFICSDISDFWFLIWSFCCHCCYCYCCCYYHSWIYPYIVNNSLFCFCFTHICIHTCMGVCIYMCLGMCICMCTRIYIYIHTHVLLLLFFILFYYI